MKCNRIITNKNCNIVVQDESNNENFVYIYVLQLNRSYKKSNQIVVKTKYSDETVFDFSEDGFYTLLTLEVPINDGKSPYYYEKGHFFKNSWVFGDSWPVSFKDSVKELSLQELIDTDPNISGVKQTYDYYFSVCNLKKCFSKICYDIYEKQVPFTCNSSKLDKNLIYKRDLIWSAMNVIKYLSEMERYEEAERLLERIIGCNGLCQECGTIDCGCSQ